MKKKIIIAMLLLTTSISYAQEQSLTQVYNKAQLLLKTHGCTTKLNIKIVQGSSYYKDGVLYISENADNQTLAHELGHHVQHSEGYFFDIAEVDISRMDELWRSEFGFFERRSQETRTLQDLISALSKGKIRTRYKHKWEGYPYRDEEVFANIYSILVIGNKKQINFLNKLLTTEK